LRVTPAPDVDLPFDDERITAHLAHRQDTLPLPFDSDVAAPTLRLVPTGNETLDGPDTPMALETLLPEPTTLLERPRVLVPNPDVRMLVQAFCEVLSGTRPAVQLTTSVSPSVLAALRSSAGAAPWRSSDGGVGPRPAVRSVHVRETSDGVLDVCAVVRRGPRHHALALRMRRRRTRWETTTVQVG
jgi:hypothetical protein